MVVRLETSQASQSRARLCESPTGALRSDLVYGVHELNLNLNVHRRTLLRTSESMFPVKTFLSSLVGDSNIHSLSCSIEC